MNVTVPAPRAHPRDRQAALAAAAAVLAVVAVLATGLLTGWTAFVKLFYPLAAVGVGGWLYMTRPVLYVGYTWGVWFVTPFVRRLVDFAAGGFDATSPIMVAPLLVTGLAVFSPLRYWAILKGPIGQPIRLCAFGVAFGYLIGVARVGAFSATFALLEWGLPLVFGAHVLLLWKSYPEQVRTLRTTFAWSVLLTGVYGIVQYVTAPSWDMAWLVGSGMTSSMGSPVARGFRAFSTLNSTGTFAFFLASGLIALAGSRSVVAKLAAVPGAVALLLTLVRASWVGVAVGALLLVRRLQGPIRRRLVIALVVGAGLGVPLSGSLGGDAVGSRMQTFGSIEQDNSFRSRLAFTGIAARNVLTNPIGEGLGGTGTAAKLSGGSVVVFDNGYMNLPHTLGWLGALLYGVGLWVAFRRAWPVGKAAGDVFATVAVVVAAVYLVLLAFTNVLSGIAGLTMWAFLASALAAREYHGLDGSP